MLTELDIRVMEELRGEGPQGILDQILTKDRLAQCYRRPGPGRVKYEGSTADIYPAGSILTLTELFAVEDILKRPISENLLIKVAKSGGEGHEFLQRDFFICTKPEFRPFVVATANRLYI